MGIQYPYIPNSNESVKREMLDSLGINSVEEIYSFIPQEIRMDRPLNLPKPFLSEHDLKRHVDGIPVGSIQASSVQVVTTTMFRRYAMRSTDAPSFSPLIAVIPMLTTAKTSRFLSSPV